MTHKPSERAIQLRLERGVSFRLMAPLLARRQNFVLGQKQRVASIEKIRNNKIEIVWNGALAVANLGQHRHISETISLPNSNGIVVATPESPESESTSGTISVPRSAPLVMDV